MKKFSMRLLEQDICSLIGHNLITMSRGREILQLTYMEKMREIYKKYADDIIFGRKAGRKE